MPLNKTRTMTQNATRPLAAAALLAVALAGCSSPYPSAGRTDMLPPGAYPRNVTSGGIGEGVVFGEPVVTVGNEARPMSVIQPVRNILDYPINVQYRFEFIDVAKRPLPPDAGWTFKALPPKVLVNLEGAALQTSAVDYRLTVRSAR